MNNQAYQEQIKDPSLVMTTQKNTAIEIAECLELIFNCEKELRKIFGDNFIKVNYSTSNQEGSKIFFAKFEINRALMTIKKTFLFDIYNRVAGFEPDKRYLENEVKRFLYNMKNFN